MKDNPVRLQFFRHLFGARQDEKLIRLERKEGMAGIGLWWCLLELLGPATDHKLKCDYEDLAYTLHVEPEQIKNIVEKYGLFVVENGFFWNESFSAQMNELNEKYKRRAAAGSLGGKKAAAIRQFNSNAIAMPEQPSSNKIRKDKSRGDKEEENNIDDTSPSIEAESRHISPAEKDDATTRVFDNRISDKKFIAIVTKYMHKGACVPTEEATGLIDIFEPSWKTQDGRSFAGHEEEATQFWTIPRDRKYTDLARLNAKECRMVDEFMQMIMEGRIFDAKIINAYRGAEFDAEKRIYALYLTSEEIATYMDKNWISQFGPALIRHYGPGVNLVYKLFSGKEQ